MYTRRGCTSIHIDRWIGVVLPDGVDDCGCADPASNACATCRNSWTWRNGSSISTQRFSGTEPDRGERCARMEESGSWAGTSCSTQLRAVCKIGIHFSSWRYRSNLWCPYISMYMFMIMLKESRQLTNLAGCCFFFGAIMYILPDTFHFKVGIWICFLCKKFHLPLAQQIVDPTYMLEKYLLCHCGVLSECLCAQMWMSVSFYVTRA